MKRPTLKELSQSTDSGMDEQIADAITDAIKSNEKTIEIRPANQSRGSRLSRLLLLVVGAIGLSYWLQKSQRPGKMVRETTSKISDRAKRATDQTAEKIEEGGEEVAHRIEEGSEKAGEKVEQTGKQASEKTEEGSEKAGEKVEEVGEQTSKKTEEAGEKAAKKAEKSGSSSSSK